MSGHSQFKNIMHRKKAQDDKRARVFVKLAKEIQVAIQDGGTDPATNSTLRLAISRAQAHNMPRANYMRIIKAATDPKSSANLCRYTYEGYLSHKVAVVIECLSSNHNRITSEIKSYFSRFHGSLAKSLDHLFRQVAIFHFQVAAPSTSEDFWVEQLLPVSNLLDLSYQAEVVKIQIPFPDYKKVLLFLQDSQFVTKILTAKIIYQPLAPLAYVPSKMKSLLSFVAKLDASEDVTNYYFNLTGWPPGPGLCTKSEFNQTES